MEGENRRFSPQSRNPQSRFRYGIHFSNAPPGTQNQDLEDMFGDFGACQLVMDPGANYGWVGYNTMEDCNNAFSGLNPNLLGMFVRRGPYGAGPLLRPPTDNQFPMNYGPPGHPPRGMRRPLARPPMDYYPDYYDDYYQPMPPFDAYGYPPFEPMYPEEAFPPDCAIGPCTFCRKRTSYSCEKCGAFYCTEHCQRADWNRHRNECDQDIPPLNFGPRNRNREIVQDPPTEGMQRLSVGGGQSGRGDRASPRRSDGASEGRRPTGNSVGDGDQLGGRPQRTDQREGGPGRNDSARRADGEFNRRQNDGEGNQRPDDAPGNRRRPDDDQSRGGGFPRRNDNSGRGTEDDRRNQNGFGERRGDDRRPMGERRQDGGFGERRPMGERRQENGYGERWPMGERRQDSGFGERRGDGERRPMGDRRDENGFGERRGDSERRPMSERRQDSGFGERRGDGDRRPMGERRDENGFGERRGDSERRPMSERRQDSGFGERRGDGDRRPMGERRQENGSGERRGDGGERRNNGLGDRLAGSREQRPGGSGDRPPFGGKPKPADDSQSSPDNAKASTSSSPSGSQVKSNLPGTSSTVKELLPAERGVSINLKNNDPVVIAFVSALDSIYLIQSDLSEEFKKMYSVLMNHCKRAPALEEAPEPGRIVACQFDLDNDFYRAVLKERKGDEYVMEFIDYGNCQQCKLDKLRAIPDELKKCPRNAVKVSLKGVGPVTDTGKVFKLLGELSDNAVQLKLQFEGDITNGVELMKPDGGSVNKDITSLSGQTLAPEKTNTPASEVISVPKDKGSVPGTSVPAASPSSPLASLLTKVKKPEVPPAEKGVTVDFKSNDPVVIAHASAVDSIHLIPSEFSVEFKTLYANLASHCKDTLALEQAPAVGEVLACLYDLDRTFYRAVVKEHLPGGEYAMEFIDFGNIQNCKLDKLRSIPDEMKTCPRNAVKVSLRGVAVPDSEKTLKLLRQLSDEEVRLKLLFDGDISSGVELIKPDGVSVNKVVSSLCKQDAIPEKEDASKPKSDASDSGKSNPAVKPRSSDEVLSALLAKVKPAEPQAAAPLPAEEGVCVQLNNEDVVVITASTSTGSTFVTRANFSTSEEYLSLAGRLLDHCKLAPPLGREPRDKEVVGCHFDADGVYYRAVVLEALPNGMYNMLFCDYGNTEECKVDKLREIPNELKVLPRQAVKVYFRDVDPVPVTGSVGKVLDELSANEIQLKLRFNGSIDNGVELFRPNGKSVNEELRAIVAQSKGASAQAAASPPTEDLSPSASVPLPTGRPFPFIVFGILEEFIVAGSHVEAPELQILEQKYAPMIAEYCKSKPNEEHQPAQGEMCLARFEAEWYRALTLSVEDNGTRQVFFVDYGNTSEVQPSDIRKIPPEIKEPLHLMTLCTLVGFPHTDETWAKVRKRIQDDLDKQSCAVFANATAENTAPSIANVTVPDLVSLCSN